MQSRQAFIAAFVILVTAAAISIGGGAILREHGSGVEEQTTAATAPVEPAMADISKPTQPADAPAASRRMIDPQIVAAPHIGDGHLERTEPRAPLSKMALATPPKPTMPDKWKGTPLFQPVASAAGLIRAKGYLIALSGIDIVKEDETCNDDGGRSWTCGVLARTAFRAFLRGRAVVCAVPPEGGRDLIAAQCRIGKQDLGQWLVENGWARASESGPYKAAGEKAKADRKGIFGAPPDVSGLPPAPAPTAAVPEGQSSIIDLSGEALPVEPVTPPTDQPAPVQ